MEWWQILLIGLIAIIIGVSIGIGVDHLLFRRRRRNFINNFISNRAGEGNGGEVNSKGKVNKNEVVRGVPLFSRRSIIGLAIGLVVGVIVGLVYWVASPSVTSLERPDNELTAGGGFFDFLVPTENVTWASLIDVEVVSAGSSAVSARELLYNAEDYLAKLNGRPFHQFLSQELAGQVGENNHTAEELDQMITLELDSANSPPTINILVTAPSTREALFLATFIPQVFEEFLDAEEYALKQEEQQRLLAELESVRTALVEAQEEEATLALQEVPSELVNDPTYVSLSAVAEALSSQLNRQASQLAALIGSGDDSENYTDNLTAVQRLSEALADTRTELAYLIAASQIEGVVGNVEYQYAQGRVAELNVELSRLTDELSASLSQNADTANNNIASLSVGTPTMPAPMVTKEMRARDALLIGGLIGICAGWVALNFKWLIRGMPSPPQAARKEEEE